MDGQKSESTGHTIMMKASSTPTPKIMKRPLRCSNPELAVDSCAGVPDWRSVPRSTEHRFR